MKAKRNLGKIISLIALACVGYFVFTNWQQTDFSIIHIRWGYVLLSFLLFLSWFAYRSYLYKRLLRKKGYTLPFGLVSYYLFSSELIRYIPGNVWGVIARIVQSEKYGISRTHGTIVFIEETISMFLSASVVSGIGLLVLTELDIFWRALGVVLVISPVILIFLPQIIHLGRFSLEKLFKRQFANFSFSTSHMAALLPPYMIKWMLYAVAHYFLFLGLFKTTANPVALMTLSVTSWLVGYASLITPSGLGVRELIFTVGGSVFFPAAIAGTFALASRMWSVLAELFFLGILWLNVKRKVGFVLTRPHKT